jgi:ferredoxin
MTGRLNVDPIACTGHGLCAELFPERVRLDDWGYPIVDPAPIPEDLEDHARRAVKACPALALRLAADRGLAEPRLAARALLKSRRPDSNRGPLHYERDQAV